MVFRKPIIHLQKRTTTFPFTVEYSRTETSLKLFRVTVEKQKLHLLGLVTYSILESFTELYSF